MTPGTVLASKAVVVDANKVIAGFRYVKPDVQANLAATGSTKDDAAAITAQIVTVTSNNNAKGVILPAAATMVFIQNASAGNIFHLYPNAGGTLNGGAANAGVVIAPSGSVIPVQIAANTWWTLGYSTGLPS